MWKLLVFSIGVCFGVSRRHHAAYAFKSSPLLNRLNTNEAFPLRIVYSNKNERYLRPPQILQGIVGHNEYSQRKRFEIPALFLTTNNSDTENKESSLRRVAKRAWKIFLYPKVSKSKVRQPASSPKREEV